MIHWPTDVVCDHCDFRTHTEYPEEWLHKSCPKCGAENIINEGDIIALKAAIDMMEGINDVSKNLGFELRPGVPGEDTQSENTFIRVKFNTTAFHKEAEGR